MPPDVIGKYTYTKNLHPMGYSGRDVPLDNTVAGARELQLRPRVLGQAGSSGHVRRLPDHQHHRPDNPVEIIDWEERQPR